ncbi:MAG: 50S ribosomal protein L6 [Candidatus Competibacterales bacterium]
MSRVAKNPIRLPKGVEVKIDGYQVAVKGSKGALNLTIHPKVQIAQREDGAITFAPATENDWAITGTMRALVNNMVVGVSQGFERRLNLQGVGYRAQAQGKALNLSLGYSHPINYTPPEGITVETPSQTEVVVRGVDKQVVGAVAAKIRGFRPPEPYKGKGVRYANETIILKEAKKK